MRTNMENRWIMDLAHERGRNETCLYRKSPSWGRACEKTRVFSFVLLLIVIIIAILHKKGYSSPYPIRMIL